ncbi:hypothetical protein STRAU_1605 [Streptomyces aurantiacus JA 4570]|uniref:Uncharacterized protein n=1 Tax=Streptomyces aurantiacus JA 4570 TaxID=1286094 RepID=S4A3Q0_9ACTN|nr:hypothetical protein STRAU_1605 [Streptomyces aurantiacus JA 4570]
MPVGGQAHDRRLAHGVGRGGFGRTHEPHQGAEPSGRATGLCLALRIAPGRPDRRSATPPSFHPFE